jgi:8-oxo-dGTP diphosphatase
MLMPPQAGSAAVAIIQCHTPRKSYLLLRRATHPKDPWSGHFSFPGGRKEDTDKNLLATCIRETEEETGIILGTKELLNPLTLEPAGRNFNSPLWVQPFLFVLREVPNLTLNQNEIQSACWLDIEKFQDRNLHIEVEMLPGRIFPAYSLEDYYLWGFTYRIICTILGIENR